MSPQPQAGGIEEGSPMRRRRMLMMFLTALVLVQTLHVVEHVAQTIQVFALGVARPVAGGLLGSMFDFPWVHFAYNFTYWLGLLAVAMGLIVVGVPSFDRLGVSTILAATVAQGYHSLEHVVQIQQHLDTGTSRPPGISGTVADGVVFHLVLNSVVLIPAVVAWWRFGGMNGVLHLVRRTPSPS